MSKWSGLDGLILPSELAEEIRKEELEYEQDEIHEDEPKEPEMSFDEADALARAWKDGLVAPEDFDPRIEEWRSPEAVDEAVKVGDVHRLQRNQEIERRQRINGAVSAPEPFVDLFPIIPLDKGT